MNNKHWWFTGGVLTGVLVIIILCTTAIIGGLTTYFLLGGQITDSGQTTATIYADQGWQSTGVQVTPGMKVNIEVTDGKWTHWSGVQPYNSGEGGGYVCAAAMPASQCVEPLPIFPTGSLIGKIGSQTFGIGRNTTLTVEQLGTLWLRINDGDVGLHDNAGELIVDISTQR